MSREIKFRQPITSKDGKFVSFHFWTLGNGSLPACYADGRPDPELQQFTGLKDVNGVEIYEGDILRLRFDAGAEKDNWHTDAAYSVEPMDYEGLRLRARSMMSDDERNQHPIHNSPSFHFGSLTTDNRNGNYDRLAVAETWGENTRSRMRWRQNAYSNDVTVIGNICANPELLEEK